MMVIKETKSKNSSIKFSKKYNHVLEILNTLNSKEKEYLGNRANRKQPSPFTVYREVLIVENIPVSFLEIDNFPNSNIVESWEGFIGLACRRDENFRGKGYTSILLERAIKWAKENETIKRLVYVVEKDNKKSINLAIKFNFYKSNENSKNEFVKYFLDV